jgi:selenocysteine lyase/cysteine desulfurase
MLRRRSFLGGLITTPSIACAVSGPRSVVTVPRRSGRPEDVARDESFWAPIQRAFTADRGMINFNNGGVCPSPAIVQQSLARYLALSNEAPAYKMWQLVEPKRETVRTRLAKHFGCDREEMAITRNASESLQICQFGFDLKPGDELLTTTHDYPRMINTWKQRARREGLVLKDFSLPRPVEDDDTVVKLFEQNITPKTRLILMCHVINITGQVLPVKKVVHMARARNIPVIVDGAHAFANLDFDNQDLDCDYYATSLHKWLFAPFGTGMLYVRREKIRDLWPLMAAPEDKTNDIRKYEEIGTHPCANFVAIADAITFHEQIGARNKEARLLYLRDRWARELVNLDRVRLHTSLERGYACGIATVEIDGIDAVDLTDHLWDKHKIFVAAIKHAEFQGVRISPSVYSTTEEVDRFTEAMADVAKNGLPA